MVRHSDISLVSAGTVLLKPHLLSAGSGQWIAADTVTPRDES